MRSLWVFLLVIVALIAGIIGGVFTNFWLFPKLAELPAFQDYLQLDPAGHTIVKLIEREKEVIREDEAIFQAVEKNRAAVVTVVPSAVSTGGAGPVTGTGFFVSADGLIVTNKHLITGGLEDLKIIDNDHNVYSAEVVRKDPLSDLALLKVAGDNFSVVNLATDNSLRTGQRLVVLGSQFGRLDNFITTGTAISVNRGILMWGQAETVSRLEGVLETDSLINKDNSGGPVLDIDGKVVGLAADVVGNSAPPEYVIPVEIVREVITGFIEGKPLIRSAIGVRYKTVTADLADLENLAVKQGAILRSEGATLAVAIGGPAYRAGLREGDIITKLNGVEIDPSRGLMQSLQKFQPGEQIAVSFWREGTEREVQVRVGESK